MSYWKRLVEWCQEPSKIKIRTFNPRNVMVLITLSIILTSSITFGAWRYYFPAEAITLPFYSQEHALVQLTGDIITRERTKFHYVDRHEWGVVVHRDMPSFVSCMHVETTPGLWSVNDTLDFAGDQESKFGFHIYESDERVKVLYRFGKYTQEDLDEGIIWAARLIGFPRKYHLEGYGQWEGESMPYGTITVDDEVFKIYLMIWTEVTEGEWKGSSYIEYKEVWRGRLSFTVTIDPFEEG